MFAVLFQETGLPPATSWTVTVGATSVTTTRSLLLVFEAAGPRSFTVSNPPEYHAHPRHGTFTVSTSDLAATVHFT